jgi:hypothetical protein
VATNESPPAVGGAECLRLVGLGAVIGIPAAFLAAVFLAFVHDLEHWLWDSLPSALGHSSPPWYLVIGLPLAGAAAGMAAGTRLLITSTLFASLLVGTRGLDAVPAAVLAAVAAWLTMQALDRRAGPQIPQEG